MTPTSFVHSTRFQAATGGDWYRPIAAKRRDGWDLEIPGAATVAATHAPKTDSSARTLALDQAVVGPLRAALRRRQREEQLRLGAEWQASPPEAVGVSRKGVVFTWPDGRLINPERVSRWFA